MASVVGEPLMNWRLAPAAGEGALEDELVVLAGLQAVLLQEGRAAARRAAATSNTASTEQLSLPLRMRVRSARSPRTRLSAPMRMDLPAPVSPVMTL